MGIRDAAGEGYGGWGSLAGADRWCFFGSPGRVGDHTPRYYETAGVGFRGVGFAEDAGRCAVMPSISGLDPLADPVWLIKSMTASPRRFADCR